MKMTLQKLLMILLICLAVTACDKNSKVSGFQIDENLPSCDGERVVSFIWQANPADEMVTGYKLYVGTQPGVADYVIDVGLTTTPLSPAYTLDTGLRADTTYYFALTAYSETEESGKTSELVLSAIDCK